MQQIPMTATRPVSRYVHLRALTTGVVIICGLLASLALAAGHVLAAAPAQEFLRPLAATVIVTNTSDSGAGSLRAAVAAAAAGDTITFTAAVSGVITLSDTIYLPRSVTIAGPGADVLAVSGNNKVRILWAQVNAYAITINDITLRHGWVSGMAAALYASYPITLNNVNVLSNTAGSVGGVSASSGLVINGGVFRNNNAFTSGGGGAVSVSGPLIISGTQFISNTAGQSGQGGAVYAAGGSTVIIRGGEFRSNVAPLSGGALYVDGQLIMTDTNIISNTAGTNAGGLLVYSSAVPNITGGLFQNNRATDDGGAFYTSSGAVISGTSFISNTAGRTGGAAYVAWGFAAINGGRYERNSSITGEGGAIKCLRGLTIAGAQFISNSAGMTGGAIHDNTDITLTQVTLDGNQAGGAGGALWYRDNATIIDSQFARNTSGGAGGALETQGNLNLIAGTLAWNQAQIGGAIHHLGLRMLITNSTISSNHAITAGALEQQIYNGYMQTLIVNSTIVSNSADVTASSGIRVLSGILTVTNSILANVGGNNVQLLAGGTFSSTGHNLVNGVITRAQSTDLLNADPLIAPLQASPGDARAPLMHALLPGSPAIDGADGALCPLDDQRRVTRPQVNGCDIGAYESRGFLVSATGGQTQSTPVNAAFPAPLQAVVSSVYEEQVDGGRLSFVARLAASGASMTPVQVTVTIAAGSAAYNVSANGIGGMYTVTATARGIMTPAMYTLTNIIAQLDMNAAPDLLLTNGVSTALITAYASDQAGALAGYTVALTATHGYFAPVFGRQMLTVSTNISGRVTADYIGYSTPGVGVVRAVLAVQPEISRSVAITLVTPTTGLMGQLRKQFGQVITYTWVVTNLGPAAAQHVVITGVAPANTRVLTDRILGGAWDGADGIVTSTSSLSVNAVLQVSYAVEPVSLLGNILAYAAASSDNSVYVGSNTDVLLRTFLMKVLRT